MLETVTVQRIPPAAARRYPLRSVITRPMSGDDVEAKLEVTQLIERVGFASIDLARFIRPNF
jgi:predicted dinucleotide-binding enzyme